MDLCLILINKVLINLTDPKLLNSRCTVCIVINIIKWIEQSLISPNQNVWGMLVKSCLAKTVRICKQIVNVVSLA